MESSELCVLVAYDLSCVLLCFSVRGALYDTPAHCIRCLYADVLPAALLGDVSPHPANISLLGLRTGSHSLPSPPSSDSNGSRHHHGSSVSSGSDASASLIAHHIRNSSHFKQVRAEDAAKPDGMTPIQEMESPAPQGCCGKGACVIL